MFWLRSISFLVLVPLFLVSVLWKSNIAFVIFSIFCIFLAFNATAEFLSMLSKINKKSFPLATSLLSSLLILFILFYGEITILIPLVLFFVVSLWTSILFSKNKEVSLEKIINSSSAILLLILPLSFMPVIYRLNDGGKILLFLVLVTKVGDTGAYIVGTLTNKIMKGNHKILPSISPKKSWEGTIGGLICSVVMSVAIWNILPFESDSYILLKALIVGVILFIGGFAGDLMESSVKRACGVKDSGSIIPGMGGVLDIVDSLIINAPVFYWFLYVFYLRFSS